MEFHIWDLERVSIKIKEEFLSYLNLKMKEMFNSKRGAYNNLFQKDQIPFITFKNLLKKSNMRTFFVPLDIYLIICNGLNIKKEELEQNILLYKTAGGINHIYNPILPIKINPIFDMVFAHNIGDGTVINPKHGRLPYFGYRQFDEFYKLAYVKKIESIFGNIFYRKDYLTKTTRPYCPPVLSSLFFKYYNLNLDDFLSCTARIPNFLFDNNKDGLLAILIAFIIDEGNIDSTQITIHLHNELLIKDLGEICKLLDYDYTITKGVETSGNFDRLHILRKGMKKLWFDYRVLNKKYPIIHLGWKGKKIEDSFKIYNREIKNIKGNIDIILSLLTKEPLSVNQIAERLSMTRQGVRYHIHNLINKNKIKIIDDTKSNWIYGV